MISCWRRFIAVLGYNIYSVASLGLGLGHGGCWVKALLGLWLWPTMVTHLVARPCVCRPLAAAFVVMLPYPLGVLLKYLAWFSS
jgi:hypothetical protein